MASLLHLREGECRTPETEVLPDGRKRLTRFFLVPSTAEIPTQATLPFGTIDDFPQGQLAGPWQGLRLTGIKITDDIPPRGQNNRPVLQLIYEQIDATGETQVGNADVTHTDDGRITKVLQYLQFSTGTYAPGTVGVSTAPGDSTLFLLDEKAPDDGDLRRITRTYVNQGILSTDDQLKNNGMLEIKTIISAITVPTTPAGYILTGRPVQHPAGLPVYTYTYAKGNGQISFGVEYRLSENAGAVGMTVWTIKYLSDPSVSSSPISNPGSGATIQNDFEEMDGYRLWTAIFAFGQGTVISGVQTLKKGCLIIYTATALNAAPSTPSATIGGTVNLIESSTRRDRFHEGQVIYDYRWAEAQGTIDLETTGREDGSIVYQVTEIANTKLTPPYPGTGGTYLIKLKQTNEDGFYSNYAEYIQLPASMPLYKTMGFQMPGLAYTIGNQVVLQPPVKMTILGLVTVDYSTSQVTTVPFGIIKGSSFYDSYVVTASKQPYNHSEALGDYLSAGLSSSGTNSVYNGVLCDSWAFATTLSSPAALPTGSTTIHVNNDPYLTTTTGTVVYRRTVTTYTF